MAPQADHRGLNKTIQLFCLFVFFSFFSFCLFVFIFLSASLHVCMFIVRMSVRLSKSWYLIHYDPKRGNWVKGQTASPKRMNFRKSSKQPLTPPPSFSENHIVDFATKVRDFAKKVLCSLCRDCHILYDPISHEMHVVQQFNMVIGWKAYHEKTLFVTFSCWNAPFKGPNFAI